MVSLHGDGLGNVREAEVPERDRSRRIRHIGNLQPGGAVGDVRGRSRDGDIGGVAGRAQRPQPVRLFGEVGAALCTGGRGIAANRCGDEKTRRQVESGTHDAESR